MFINKLGISQLNQERYETFAIFNYPAHSRKSVESSSGRHIIQDYDKNNHAFERIMRKLEFFFDSRVKRTGLRGANYTQTHDLEGKKM